MPQGVSGIANSSGLFLWDGPVFKLPVMANQNHTFRPLRKFIVVRSNVNTWYLNDIIIMVIKTVSNGDGILYTKQI